MAGRDLKQLFRAFGERDEKERFSPQFMQSRSPFAYREAIRQGIAPT